MPLAAHVDVDNLVKNARDGAKGRKHHGNIGVVATGYAGKYTTGQLPRYTMPSDGVSADAAYQVIHDMTDLDGRPNLNLASFVHTHMEPEADKLMLENVSKNLIDEDEYPATVDIHHRCVSMISHLWHVGQNEKAIGTATTGSSEGILLAGMALKRNWQARMKKAGKDIHNPGPNIIMGANAQVCLEKFARYFEVEARMIPVSKESRYCLDVKKAIEACDENTIGVFVILGSTYTGHFESVKEMSDELDKLEKEKGLDIPIHVDAASGGFFAPFVYPKLTWDFKLPRVKSIQSSGHKFGLAYVGVGWVVWRDKKYLPSELIFELHYLGSVELSFSLNFSRPAAPIIAQYYSLIRNGFSGYQRIGEGDLVNARLFSRALEQSGYFKVLSEIHKPAPESQPGYSSDEHKANHYLPGLPVVGFAFSDEFKQRNPSVQQKWVQTLLRVKQYIVPNYALPPSVDKDEVLRVVVRESTSEDLIDDLLHSLFEIMETLDEADSPEHALATLHERVTGKSKTPAHPSTHEDLKADDQNATGAPC